MTKSRLKKPKQKPLIINLFPAHPAQRALIECGARFRVCCTGRRWGKTLCGVNEAIKAAGDKTGSVVWWVAPTYKITLRAYRMMTRFFEKAFISNSKSELRLTLPNKSVIEFLSTDNYDALRGEGVSFLVLDEAAYIRREAWEDALRPTLSDTRGRALFFSTPKGRNFFHELWCRGEDPEFAEWKAFHFPTSSNPYIPAAEIEEARHTLPQDTFRQEYEAAFLEDSAGVFRRIRDRIRGGFEEPKRNARYVIGWDLAKHVDFDVRVVMDIMTGHVVAYERSNEIDYTLQVERTAQLAKRYNNALVLMDSTGAGDPVLEQIRRKGTNVQGYSFTNTSKKQLIEHLALQIEQGAITYPDIPVLLNELSLYQYEITAAGNVRYNAPEGFHDDTVIALALASWARAHNAPIGTVSKPRGW